MSENFDRAAIISAVERAGLKRICESCSQVDGWMIPSRADDPDIVEVMSTIRADDPWHGFAFVPMICLHCGSTRFLHLETLMSKSKPVEIADG